jgi:hypothetical protein
MGDEIPITWEALWSYAQATGALAEPWEFRIVMDMSLAYVARGRRSVLSSTHRSRPAGSAL